MGIAVPLPTEPGRDQLASDPPNHIHVTLKPTLHRALHIKLDDVDVQARALLTCYKMKWTKERELLQSNKAQTHCLLDRLEAVGVELHLDF